MKILRMASKILVVGFNIGLLIACNVFAGNVRVPGVTYLINRGTPRASSIFWSPTDSDEILVSGIDLIGHNSEIYILDISTNMKKVLIDDSYSGIVGKGWSMSGSDIMLSVEGATKRFSQHGSWLMNTEDNSIMLLFDRPSNIVWLPDGNTLAFLTLDLISAQNPRRISIYLMDIHTKQPELIYSNRDAVAFSGLSSSPDGKYLTFSLDFGDTSAISDLYILDIQNRTVAQVTHDGISGDPRWSPKGDLIVYVKSNNTSTKNLHSLHIIMPDGACDIEIPYENDSFSPTWSPDGRKIAFIGDNGIYVLDIDIAIGRDIYKELCPE